MATTTYVPIQTQSLNGVSTVTFSGLSTYTQYRIVCTVRESTAGTGVEYPYRLRVNGVAGGNYA